MSFHSVLRAAIHLFCVKMSALVKYHIFHLNIELCELQAASITIWTQHELNVMVSSHLEFWILLNLLRKYLLIVVLRIISCRILCRQYFVLLFLLSCLRYLKPCMVGLTDFEDFPPIWDYYSSHRQHTSYHSYISQRKCFGWWICGLCWRSGMRPVRKKISILP